LCLQLELVSPDGDTDPRFPVTPFAMAAALADATAQLGMNISVWWPLGAPSTVDMFMCVRIR
jgi:hypothetical protein